jgi:hypothetical protein
LSSDRLSRNKVSYTNALISRPTIITPGTSTADPKEKAIVIPRDIITRKILHIGNFEFVLTFKGYIF